MSLDELRAELATVDDQLLELVARRQELATAIGRIKHEAGVLGLYKTLHRLDAACQAIGWEVARIESKEEGIPFTEPTGDFVERGA